MGKEKRNLPEGWGTIKMDELMVKTPSVNPANRPTNKYELWSVPAFPTDAPEYVQGEDVGSNKQIVQPGDVLLCKINPRINRVWLVREKTGFDQIASTEWIVLRCNELLPEFIMYLLREEGFRKRLCSDLSGIGGSLTRARPRIVGKLEIDLSPLNEQKRIVAKIEELQARSRQAREALETVPDLLEQLRQSILSAAFRGDLTKEWRKNNPNIEPASELLKRIRTERRKRWESAELEKLKAKGLNGDKLEDSFAKQRKKYKEPVPVDTSDLPELPEGWCWAIVEELSLLVTKGSSPRWQGFEYTTTGVPFVRSQNVLSGSLDLAELAFLPKSFNKKERRSILAANDVLVNIVGASIGRAALATEDIAGGNVNQAVAMIRLIQEGFLPSLMVYWLLSPTGQRQIHGGKVDVARANLSLTDVSAIIVSLPPFVEQEELVFQLCENMKLLARLSDKIVEIQTSLDDLDYAALTKAFRGQLVPQDPKDEPASVLLERIRQEKEQEAANQKPRNIQKGKKRKKLIAQ